jgi:hypothetical protein
MSDKLETKSYDGNVDAIKNTHAPKFASFSTRRVRTLSVEGLAAHLPVPQLDARFSPNLLFGSW